MTDFTTNDELDRKQARELAEARRQKRKKQKKIAAGVVAVFALLVWYALQPLRAGMNYGVCRTYLETRMKYPTSYNITQFDEYGLSLRIFYTYVDAFGGTRSEMIECISNPGNDYTLQAIKIDRKPIDAEELRRFNLAIPGIVANNPDTVIPRPGGDDLQSLKRD